MKQTKGRIIFHIDMNCFFASCEIANNKELKGKKVIVVSGTTDRKGMVLAVSYEARPFGVYTTQRVSEALKLCPDAVFLIGNYKLYAKYSRHFFDYFLSITPLVEPASIDEGYLDVTDVCINKNALDLAKEMQNYILHEIGLPASIGIGPNKFLAKMASDLKKPLGITIIRKRDVKEILYPLPVNSIFGIGKKTYEKLKILNIKTVGDLALFQDLDLLDSLFGVNGRISLISSANGEGSNVLDVSRMTDYQSISNSHTLDYDEYDLDKIKNLISKLSNSIALRLIKNKNVAKTFTLTIKYNNFKTINRSKTFDQPLADETKMKDIFIDLFNEFYDPDYPVRLVGVSASKLSQDEFVPIQLSIFDNFTEHEKDHSIDNLIKKINKELGQNVLSKGIKKRSEKND